MNNTIDAQAVLAQMRALTAQARGLDMPRAANAVNPLGRRHVRRSVSAT